jgi:hypothetical protein
VVLRPRPDPFRVRGGHHDVQRRDLGCVAERHGYWAFVRRGNASSGTVDLLAGLKFLESRGSLTGTDKLWQVNFGWEICSTAGAPETFTVSNYSVNSTPSS